MNDQQFELIEYNNEIHGCNLGFLKLALEKIEMNQNQAAASLLRIFIDKEKRRKKERMHITRGATRPSPYQDQEDRLHEQLSQAIKPLREIERQTNKCRHFNGIQHETCNAGVRYIDVREITLTGRRRPCFKEDGCPERCPLVSYYSEQEAIELVVQQDAEVAAFLKELTEGKTCPHCHAPIESLYQRGRCTYAWPCQCRQYQGVVPENKRTAADQEQIDEASLWSPLEGEEAQS